PQPVHRHGTRRQTHALHPPHHHPSRMGKGPHPRHLAATERELKMNIFDSQSIEDRLKSTSHQWVLFMRWCELVFASWRVPVETLRPLVPAELEIDTFDGSAW